MNDYQVSYAQGTLEGFFFCFFFLMSYVGLTSNNLKFSLGKTDCKYMKDHSRAEHKPTSSPSKEQEEMGLNHGEKYGKISELAF